MANGRSSSRLGIMRTLRIAVGMLSGVVVILLITAPPNHVPENFIRIAMDSLRQTASDKFIQSGRFTTKTDDGSVVSILTGAVSDRSKVGGQFLTDDIEITVDRATDSSLRAIADHARITPTESTIELVGDAIIETGDAVTAASDRFTLNYDDLSFSSDSEVEVMFPNAMATGGCLRIGTDRTANADYATHSILMPCGAKVTFEPS